VYSWWTVPRKSAAFRAAMRSGAPGRPMAKECNLGHDAIGSSTSVYTSALVPPRRFITNLGFYPLRLPSSSLASVTPADLPSYPSPSPQWPLSDYYPVHH
jgi:hypothetical protein